MSKCKITGNVLAVQLGREQTQLVLLGKNSEILHAVSLATPVGAVEDGNIQNAEALCAMLKEVLKTPELKKARQVVFSLCTTQVITEVVTTPDLPMAKLERLLMANIDMYFPVSMNDYHVVWQSMGPKPSESDLRELLVQLWAVPKSMLIPYYGIANACGLSVAAIDYCGNSIASLVGASFAQPAGNSKPAKKFSWNMEIGGSRKKNEEAPAPQEAQAEPAEAIETNLHILLERDILGMTFVQKGQVVYQRFIQCGSDPSYQFTELAMMLEYFRSLSQGRSSRIQGYLCGSLATQQALVEELNDMLDVEIHLYGGSHAPELCLCMGAVRTTLDFGNPELNRPGKARRQVASQLWQYILVLISGLVLTGVVMLVLTSRLTWSSKEKSLESTMQNWQIQAKQTAGYADNYHTYSSLYDSYSADWDTIFSNLQTYNDNLVRVLQELEETLPEKTSVVKLQINADGINVEFACENKEEAAYLIMALRELEYADLVGISNLSGGGAGPATDYGTGRDGEVETPPTVGSGKPITVEVLLSDVFSLQNRATQPVTLVDLMQEELSEDELMDLATSMTPEQFVALEEAYGKMPTNVNTTLEVLKLAQGNKDITNERKEAVRQLLTTNPFTMNRFLDLVEEDFERTDEKPILLLELMKDDDFQELWEKINDDTQTDKPLMEYLNSLIDILVKDENLLSSTERLICTNEIEEKWYVYYLEVELKQQEAQPFPYLDLSKVVTDMMDGHFDTSNVELNQKLNALISDDTWTLITSLSSEAGIQSMMNLYLTTGSTGNKYLDGSIETYLATGSTGIAVVDERIEEYITSGKLDSMLESLLNQYLTTGTTGNDKLDGMIADYLSTGSTGSTVLDETIADYMESDAFVNKVKELVEAYSQNGTTGSKALDAMIEDMIQKYLKNGTTGNAKIDSFIKTYLSNLLGGNENSNPNDENSSTVPGLTDEQIENLLMQYITTGTTGIEHLDELINKFLETGTTGNEKLDDIVEDYIEKKTEEFTKEQVTQMMNDYLTKGTTGNKAYDELIQKYIKTGTTGIEKLDQLIKEFVTDYMNNTNNGADSLMGAIDSIFGGGTGAGGQQVDTRIHFTVSLGYNDALKNAELIRKGLDYSEKLDKVEVTE